MSYNIDYSDSSSDPEEEIVILKEKPLTPSLLKNHEKQFQVIDESDNEKDYFERVQTQLNDNNSTMLVHGFVENLEMLRTMNEEICERLDWVTQQTQLITERFNEDRQQAQKERKKDRLLDVFFSLLELNFFLIGIIYATILFIIEMYYSVNFNFF
jgi:hypothetical protein